MSLEAQALEYLDHGPILVEHLYQELNRKSGADDFDGWIGIDCIS